MKNGSQRGRKAAEPSGKQKRKKTAKIRRPSADTLYGLPRRAAHRTLTCNKCTKRQFIHLLTATCNE